MPRQTAAAYYKAYQQLRRFWLQNSDLYAELSSLESGTFMITFSPAKNSRKNNC
jgi:hypothetical protein